MDSIISQHDEHFYQAFREYLTTDPEGTLRLRACAMQPPNDRCNCFALVDLLYFLETPLNKTKAAAELEVNYFALDSHWKRNCLLLLRKISAEIAQKCGTEID